MDVAKWILDVGSEKGNEYLANLKSRLPCSPRMIVEFKLRPTHLKVDPSTTYTLGTESGSFHIAINGKDFKRGVFEYGEILYRRGVPQIRQFSISWFDGLGLRLNYCHRYKMSTLCDHGRTSGDKRASTRKGTPAERKLILTPPPSPSVNSPNRFAALSGVNVGNSTVPAIEPATESGMQDVEEEADDMSVDSTGNVPSPDQASDDSNG